MPIPKELILRGDLPESAVALVGMEKGKIVIDALRSRKAAKAG